jgi:hypothetical protein
MEIAEKTNRESSGIRGLSLLNFMANGWMKSIRNIDRNILGTVRLISGPIPVRLAL